MKCKGSIFASNSNSLQNGHLQVRQKSSLSKVLKSEMVDSIVSMSGRSTAHAKIPKPSVEVNNVAIDRFLKIQRISERYGLVNKKHKSDQIAEKRPFFSQIPSSLVGFHLASFEDNGESEESGGYEISPFKFLHESHIILRSDSPMVEDNGQSEEDFGGYEISPFKFSHESHVILRSDGTIVDIDHDPINDPSAGDGMQGPNVNDEDVLAARTRDQRSRRQPTWLKDYVTSKG